VSAAAADLSIERLQFEPKRSLRSLQAYAEAAVTAGSLDRTMLGASTLNLVLSDPKRTLLRSGVFKNTIDVSLDANEFRLVQVQKSADDLSLTFEDLVVSRLRDKTGARHASRSQMTRAEFALSLVRELAPQPPFRSPHLHQAQPVAKPAPAPQTPTTAQAASTNIGLEALWLKAGGTANVSKTMAAIALAESGGRIGAVGGPNSNGTYDYGLWQINSSHSAYDRHSLLTDPLYNARAAVSIYQSQGLSAWSTYTSGAYRSHLDAASKALVSGKVDSRAQRKALPYQFRRGAQNGKLEDSWACLQRLAQEVNWRCFVSEGVVYFVSDPDLLAAGSALEVREFAAGVDGIDFDIDQGKVKNQVTLTAESKRWTLDPGSVVTVDGCGPADGDWLVQDVSRDLFNPQATVTLQRASKPLAEPAPQLVAVPASKKATLGIGPVKPVDGNVAPEVLAAYRAAAQIDRGHYPYVWGGGHSQAGKPSGGPPAGFDCSGSVTAVLAAARMGFRLGGPTDTSGQLANWGAAGRGKWLTVYASSVHTFMVFTDVAKKGDEHFGTGDYGKGWGGAGFNPYLHPTGGFSARHWPGT
jgi:hypothetical protein